MARKRVKNADIAGHLNPEYTQYEEEFFYVKLFKGDFVGQLRELKFADKVTLVFQVIEPSNNSVEAQFVKLRVKPSDFSYPL